MRISTRAFGPIEVDETQLITLTEPMPGFAHCRRFAVLEPDPETPVKWLQSVEREDVCFLVADPKPFFPDYRLDLRTSDLTDLAIEGRDEAGVAVVLTIPADTSQATANLLAPIIFNTRRKLARQVILEGSDFGVRTRLFPEEKKVCHGP